MRHMILVLFLTSLGSWKALAQPVDLTQYEKVLLPVLSVTSHGAFNSEWYSLFLLHNDADVPAAFYPIVCPYATCPPDENFYVDPRVTLTPSTVFSAAAEPGLLFYVRKDVAPRVSFHLRSRDLSRRLDTWGTEIPIVKEDEVIEDGRVILTYVPVGERFRSTLRIYDFDARGDAAVMVRIFDHYDGTPLHERRVDLTIPEGQYPPATKPGYAQLSPINEVVPGNRDVRIEIEPLTPGLRYWAFVSVTNNETQHVTTITPQ